MERKSLLSLVRALATLTITGLAVQAATAVPLDLPRPDGKPGFATKPVKVYILAGQSNMVGMGDISGARPQYPSIYLAADPAVIPGVMPVGQARNSWNAWVGVSALAVHGIYRSADPKAEKDAVVSLFKGDYDPKENYSKRTPDKTGTVALGTVAASLPTMDGPYTVVVSAWIDVPLTGTYTLHPGFGDSTHAVVSLDGKEVYRKEVGGEPACDTVGLAAGKRYPVTVTYFKGGSAAFWMEQVDLPGHGDLETVTKRDKKFPYLLDDAGKWTVRNDVYFQEARLAEGGKGAPLSATANNGKSIGPEVGFGYVMGTFHDEQVLLIKTAQGNRSLNWDFRPPSSGRSDREGADKWEGFEYRLMVKGVRETLDKLDKVVPGYKGQGYEIAGFGWFQGHKDKDAPKEEYEKHLANLINDLRKEFNVPKMPAVVATVGFHGYRLSSGGWNGVWQAQMAVGDPKQHPEFAGTVASVDTREFWREVEESPRSQDYHYNRNAETYMLVGEAMGRAMVRLQGGNAEAIPKSGREAKVAAEVAAEAAKPVLTDEQKAAHMAAIKPMILDGVLASYLSNPKNQPLLQAAVKGQKPARKSPFVDDVLDEVVEYYQAAGIQDYDWKPFGGDMKNGTWEYLGFDLPGHPNRVNAAAAAGAEKEPEADDDNKAEPKAKGKDKAPPSLKITWPAGMENWFASDFDTKKAGWKSGTAPFGESAEKLVLPDFVKDRAAKRQPKTVCDNDVLLLRQTFEIPPLKEGCRYRVRVAGSAHNNMGESYAIYVNGQLLFENREGVTAWRRQGGSPRGVPVYPEFCELFKGGKVTIAVSSFPMDNFSADRLIPPGAALSVWLEEMKIPPLGK
jgi:alpha-galactosidase